MMKFTLVAIATAICASSLSPLLAANGDHPCTEIVSGADRLACYDEAFGGRTSEQQAAEAAAAAEQAKKEFGLASRDVRETQPKIEKSAVVKELASQITSVSKPPGSSVVVALANGQAWSVLGTLGRTLSVGDTVSIKAGPFSSYKLITPSGAGLKAKRVR